MVEAIIKALIAAVIVFFALRLAPKIMTAEPAWWLVALIAIAIGFVGGGGIGAIIGGISRTIWNPTIIDEEDTPND